MPFINVITEIFSKLKDGAGNSLTSTTVSEKQALDVNVVSGGGTTSSTVDIVDQEGDHIEIGPEGRLHVSSSLPVEIADYDKWELINCGRILGHNYQLAEYLIPDTKKLIIGEILIGGEGGSSVSSLYYSPTGIFGGVDDELVYDFFTNGNSTKADVDYWFTGDGTAKIFTRIKRLTKGRRSISCIVKGFIAQ